MTICPICKSDKAFCNCSPTHILAGTTELETLRAENARLKEILECATDEVIEFSNTSTPNAAGTPVPEEPSLPEAIRRMRSQLYEENVRLKEQRDTMASKCDAERLRAEELETDLAYVTQERDKARRAAGIGGDVTCEICNWTNNGCLKVQGKWTCHGCIDRGFFQLTELRSQLTAANEARVKAEEESRSLAEWSNQPKLWADNYRNLKQERDSLRAKLQQAEYDKELAIKEANRRDDKWKAGLDEIFGPNEWDAPLANPSSNTPERKWRAMKAERDAALAALESEKANALKSCQDWADDHTQVEAIAARNGIETDGKGYHISIVTFAEELEKRLLSALASCKAKDEALPSLIEEAKQKGVQGYIDKLVAVFYKDQRPCRRLTFSFSRSSSPPP